VVSDVGAPNVAVLVFNAVSMSRLRDSPMQQRETFYPSKYAIAGGSWQKAKDDPKTVVQSAIRRAATVQNAAVSRWRGIIRGA
jgi:hypothetical protein